MSNYGAMLKGEWLLLPVVYTTIRTTGNPLDMVVGDRGENGHTRCSAVDL